MSVDMLGTNCDQCLSMIQYCLTETARLIRTESPGRHTSTLTQLLNSVLIRWFVECCFTSTETVGLLGTGAQDVHLDFHTAPELCVDPMMMS